MNRIFTQYVGLTPVFGALPLSTFPKWFKGALRELRNSQACRPGPLEMNAHAVQEMWCLMSALTSSHYTACRPGLPPPLPEYGVISNIWISSSFPYSFMLYSRGQTVMIGASIPSVSHTANGLNGEPEFVDTGFRKVCIHVLCRARASRDLKVSHHMPCINSIPSRFTVGYQPVFATGTCAINSGIPQIINSERLRSHAP